MATDPIIVYTLLDMRTLACPLCEFRLDVAPVPVSDQLGQAFGMSGDTLARIHADQRVERASDDMRTHLKGHAVEEWLAAVVSINLVPTGKS